MKLRELLDGSTSKLTIRAGFLEAEVKPSERDKEGPGRCMSSSSTRVTTQLAFVEDPTRLD